MKARNDHLNRLITGGAGIVAVSLVVGYASEPVFFLCVLTATSFMLKEYYELRVSAPTGRWLGISLGLAAVSAFFFVPRASLFLVPATIGILFCLWQILKFPRAQGAVSLRKHDAVGGLFVAFMLAHLLWLRALPHGRLWIFYLLAVVFAGDVCAFYGGQTFGRHRLAPRISPKKTVEGAVCGLIGSCVGGGLMSFGIFPSPAFGALIPLAALLGVFGQLGDLWESTLKRKAKVKDSGTLLPGHGGIFDRLDSILFTVPVLYYCVLFREGLW
jgi:phosphatidate cytidylyltransferase